MSDARIVEIDISFWNIVKLTFKFMVAAILVGWIPFMFMLGFIGMFFGL